MKADLIIKIIIPPVIIFALLIWLTVEKVITGWSMYGWWIVGFIVANLIVTRITAQWSIKQRRAKRLAEEKKAHNDR